MHEIIHVNAYYYRVPVNCSDERNGHISYQQTIVVIYLLGINRNLPLSDEATPTKWWISQAEKKNLKPTELSFIRGPIFAPSENLLQTPI